MSTPKVFKAVSTKRERPIEFQIVSDEGEDLGVFRAMRKPRTDVIQRLARAVMLKDDGHRAYDANVICESIRDVLVREVWVEEPGTAEDGSEAEGRWVPADDVDRFDHLLRDDRVRIPIDQLGEICMWLVGEMMEDPTGASRP